MALIERLDRNGYLAYVVGGCVRDAIMGKEPHDWDVCTSATPRDVIACFPEHPCLEVGARFGTVVLVVGGEQFEITTFRSDGIYSDGRRPDKISYADSLEEYLSRRDFTMNAIAFHPKAGYIDPFGGRWDIDRQLVRCVGEPDMRFAEDGLRILRAVRFAATLGFDIAPDTQAGMLRNLAMLGKVSSERIRDELCKMLLGDPHKMDAYRDVLAYSIPELRPMFDFEQNNPHHYLGVWGHTIEAVSVVEPHVVLRLTMLFHDIGKPYCYTESEGVGHFYGHPDIGEEIASRVMHRLKFDNETIADVKALVKYHDTEVYASEKAARRWLNRLGEQQFRRLLAVKRADRLAHSPVNRQNRLNQVDEVEEILDRVIAEKQCFSLKDLNATGRDIIGLGVAPGPQIGRVLSALLGEVINGTLANERSCLLDRARELCSI